MITDRLDTVIPPREGEGTATVNRPRETRSRRGNFTVNRPRVLTSSGTPLSILRRELPPISPVPRLASSLKCGPSYRAFTQARLLSTSYREMSHPLPVSRTRQFPVSDPDTYREPTQAFGGLPVFWPRDRSGKPVTRKANPARNFRSNYHQDQKSLQTFLFLSRGGEGW